MNSASRLDELDWLRGVAIVFVIGIHSSATGSDIAHALRGLFSIVAVPTFFFVDGILFGHKHAHGNALHYAKYLRSSAARLLVPWFFFNVLYALTRLLFESTGLLNDHLILGRTVFEAAIATYGSVIAQQMYFLLSLFLIRSLSIVNIRLLYVPLGWAVLIIGSYLAIYHGGLAAHLRDLFAIKHGQEPILHAFWGLQYYLIGLLVGRYYSIVRRHAKGGILLCLLVVGIIWEGSLGPEFFTLVIQFGLMLALFGIALVLARKDSMITALGTRTMGIYLIHAPILLKGVSTALKQVTTIPLLSYGLTIFTVLIVAWGVTIVIEQFSWGRRIFGDFSKKCRKRPENPS